MNIYESGSVNGGGNIIFIFCGFFCHCLPRNLATDGLQSDCRQQSVPSPAVAILSSAALLQSPQYALL